MVRHGVVTERVQILLAIENVVDHAFDPSGHQHCRPGDLLRFAVGLAAQKLLHQMASHLVIAVEAVEAAVKGVRQAERADEITHSDLAVAQLRLKGLVAVDLEGVEEDLAIGRLNHEVLIFAIHSLVHRHGFGILVRAHAKGIHTRVLRCGRVLQEGKGHSNFGIRRV